MRKSDDAVEDEDLYEIEPIGMIETVFGEKHGTPRQGILAPDVRGIIRLRRELGTFDAHLISSTNFLKLRPACAPKC